MSKSSLIAAEPRKGSQKVAPTPEQTAKIVVAKLASPVGMPDKAELQAMHLQVDEVDLTGAMIRVVHPPVDATRARDRCGMLPVMWCPWCGERITVGVVTPGGIVYRVACWRGRRVRLRKAARRH